jgi:hypothetical protein
VLRQIKLTNVTCFVSHKMKKPIACLYYLENVCKFGEECKFVHDNNSPGTQMHKSAIKKQLKSLNKRHLRTQIKLKRVLESWAKCIEMD